MLFKLLSRLLLLTIIFAFGCNQFADLDDVQRAGNEAEYAVPLVNSSFSMNDLLENFEENSVLTVLPDGLLRLQYSGDVITESTDDVLLAINDFLSQVGVVPLTEERQSFPFSGPEGIDIDIMDLKAGQLNFLITNCHDKEITATISFPSVTNADGPLTITRTLDAYSGNGDCPSINNALAPVSMEGYTITAPNDSVYVDYEAIDSDGVSIPPSVNTFILVQSLAFSYAEGYMGQVEHSSDRDTIEIDFFDNWIQGDVFFEDPVITFNFENSFGIPTRANIETFNIISVEGETLALESDFITNGIDFPYPTLDQIGETVTEDFVFDRNNSTIREVLSAGPVAIDYDVDAITNPESNTEVIGFVTDSSYYAVKVDVELPLYGWAINFSARDTFTLDLSSFEDIDYAEFKLVTENEMPVAIGVQGYFLDANGTVLDSLFSSSTRVIEGAPVDAIGNPTSAIETVTFSDFPSDRFENIRKATQLEIVATFFSTTDGNQSVRILADQDVKVKLGAILGVSNE